MKTPTKKYYQENEIKYSKSVSDIKKKLRLLSVLRLVSFIASIACLIFFIKQNVALATISGFAFFILFLFLVKKYIVLQRTLDIQKKLLLINQHEIQALNDNYAMFGPGEDHLDIAHDYAHDIDLFGQGSLFQFLNRNFSFGGNALLAKWLKDGLPSGQAGKTSEQIAQTQLAITELEKLPDYRQLFTATGMLNTQDKNKVEQLYGWLNSRVNFRFKQVLKPLTYILPALAFLSLGTAIAGILPTSVVILVFFVNLTIVGIYLKTTNRVHALLQRQFTILDNYASLLLMLENQSFTSQVLHDLKKQIKNSSYRASHQIKKLSAIISFFDYRLNMLVAVFLNGLLLWDMQCLFRLEKWKKACAPLVPTWINVISETDALNSLANFKFNNPGYCFPTMDGDKVLEAKDIAHPQLTTDVAVKNNIEIKNTGEFIIITGPNMAGKSTFLRTIAVNMVLARIGSVVCASFFSIKNIPLITSMRTTDSLMKHESYFYAELKRLKHIITTLKSGKPVFIILDEILKGTNSKDKQLGSIAFLEQLIKLNGTGLIATHDLALGKLEQQYPENIRNKCFEIEIEGANIFYDYKLQDGITKKMNATFLMEQMGITVSKLVN